MKGQTCNLNISRVIPTGDISLILRLLKTHLRRSIQWWCCPILIIILLSFELVKFFIFLLENKLQILKLASKRFYFGIIFVIWSFIRGILDTIDCCVCSILRRRIWGFGFLRFIFLESNSDEYSSWKKNLVCLIFIEVTTQNEDPKRV